MQRSLSFPSGSGLHSAMGGDMRRIGAAGKLRTDRTAGPDVSESRTAAWFCAMPHGRREGMLPGVSKHECMTDCHVWAQGGGTEGVAPRLPGGAVWREKQCYMLLTSYNATYRDLVICSAKSVAVAFMQGGKMKARFMLVFLQVLFMWCLLMPCPASAENSYVGTASCKDCHEEQYDNFTKYAKKAHSDRSVKAMASDLSEAELAECYACHTTGYGKPGGFVSYEATPHLADAGCEVCHGPGYEHVESGGDPELIKGSLSMEDCESCHNESRVKSFNFKPLLYGGAH